MVATTRCHHFFPLSSCRLRSDCSLDFFSPIERTEGRTWFGGIVFLILAMFTATAHHRAHVAGGIVVWVVTLAVSLFAIPQMLAGTIDLFYMSRAVQTRYTTIMTAQQNGKKNSCTPRILVHCEDQIC